MSRCRAELILQDESTFPPSGIPDFQPEHDYPTRYPDFHWWTQIANKRVCFKSIRRDEVPIPPLLEERRRYPYRYSSAGPARFGQTLRELKEEWLSMETREPKKKMQMEPRDTQQVKGYETMSMDASLQPFLYHPPTEIVTKELPPNLLLRTRAPLCAHSDFGTYVLNQLHPNHWKDPRIRKRIQFSSVDTNRELCVTMKELQHLDPKPKRKIKKKDFLFVQQRPGHRPSEESMPPSSD